MVDNIGYHIRAWHVFSRAHGHEFTDEEIVGWTGATNAFYMERMLGRPVPPDELKALEDAKEALYRKLYAPCLRLADGMREILDAAHQAGVVCAIASGAPTQNIDFVLDGLGIRDEFACVVDASQYAHGKPEPDCFLEAARRVGAAPATCIVFEDAVNGVRAAHAAGMKAVALAARTSRAVFEAVGADCIVDTFRGCLPEIRGLECR